LTENLSPEQARALLRALEERAVLRRKGDQVYCVLRTGEHTWKLRDFYAEEYTCTVDTRAAACSCGSKEHLVLVKFGGDELTAPWKYKRKKRKVHNPNDRRR